MISRRDDPFPLEAARDLLGLIRTLYIARRHAGAPAHELERIARAGREMQEAISLASSSQPRSVGHAAAWKRAETATELAMKLLEKSFPAEPLLRAAGMRITKRHVA